MEYDNIIVGAGPAGLQLAYYFEKNNINYLILEKNQSCGEFFNKYPVSNKLISFVCLIVSCCLAAFFKFLRIFSL